MKKPPSLKVEVQSQGFFQVPTISTYSGPQAVKCAHETSLLAYWRLHDYSSQRGYGVLGFIPTKVVRCYGNFACIHEHQDNISPMVASIHDHYKPILHLTTATAKTSKVDSNTGCNRPGGRRNKMAYVLRSMSKIITPPRYEDSLLRWFQPQYG